MQAFLTFTVLILVSTVAFCSEELTAFTKVAHECLEENHVEKQEFEDFMDNDMKPDKATEHLKCHLKCLMEKLGHLKNGALDLEAAIKTWSEIPEFKNNREAIVKGYQACKSEKGKDECDTAYKIAVCLKEHDVGGDLQM